MDLQTGTLKWQKLYDVESEGPNGPALDREGLSRLVLGSVTSGVLYDGHTPVVAVPPLANHQSTATRHDDDSIGSTRWA